MSRSRIYGAEDVLDMVEDRAANKYDNITAVSGGKGAGKTTMAIGLGRKHQKRKGFRYSLIDNIAYNREQIVEKAFKMPIGSNLTADEGSRAFYKRNWNTKGQKELVVKFWQIRHRELFMPICIQDFLTLDKDMRNMIDIWMHIPKRGLCMIFIKDNNPFQADGDPWHVDLNAKKMKKIYRSPRDGIDKQIEAMRSMINYMGEFRFGSLPHNIQERFDKISHQFKETSDEDIIKDDKWKDRLVTTFKNLRDSDYSFGQIASMTGIDRSQVKQLLEKKYPKESIPTPKNQAESKVMIPKNTVINHIPKELGLNSDPIP